MFVFGLRCDCCPTESVGKSKTYSFFSRKVFLISLPCSWSYNHLNKACLRFCVQHLSCYHSIFSFCIIIILFGRADHLMYFQTDVVNTSILEGHLITIALYSKLLIEYMTDLKVRAKVLNIILMHIMNIVLDFALSNLI